MNKHVLAEKKEIEHQIKWFKKFSLEKRFAISEASRKAILQLRKLKVSKT